MVFFRVVGVCEYVGCIEKFCFENGFCYKGMIEIRKFCVQFINLVNFVNVDVKVMFNFWMSLLLFVQCVVFWQICLLGFCGYVVCKNFIGNDF